MTRTRLFVQRERLLSDDGLERIEEAMLRVLENAGIAVLDSDLRKRLRGLGFETRGNRVPLERGIVERLLEELRAENGDAFGTEPVAVGSRAFSAPGRTQPGRGLQPRAVRLRSGDARSR
ncbi:MAG: trimethylamine methyltransferase family protein [Candidatus Brocadiia bacterium]